MATTDQSPIDPTDVSSLAWGADAPRGGKAVMGRILKENSTVPLFFGQTLIQSLRDLGYNHTTSALCEHVDNAIQAGARRNHWRLRLWDQMPRLRAGQTELALQVIPSHVDVPHRHGVPIISSNR